MDEARSALRKENLQRRNSYRKIYEDLSVDLDVIKSDESIRCIDLINEPHDSVFGDHGEQTTLNTALPITTTTNSSMLQMSTTTRMFAPLTFANVNGTSKAFHSNHILIPMNATNSTILDVNVSENGLSQPDEHSSPSIACESATSSSCHQDVGAKRQLRLYKNRAAAKECRRKKKEYLRCLEDRVKTLEQQNQLLIDELSKIRDHNQQLIDEISTIQQARGGRGSGCCLGGGGAGDSAAAGVVGGFGGGGRTEDCRIVLTEQLRPRVDLNLVDSISKNIVYAVSSSSSPDTE